MSPATVLRAPPEHPESLLPPHVQKLMRPEPMHTASELAFLRFEKKNLKKAEAFWLDFGLVTVSRTADQLVMRAAGAAPAVLVATKASVSRYVGAAFVVQPPADLKALCRESGAEMLSSQQIPGGGQGVSLRDPDGNEVWLIHGQRRVEPVPIRPALYGHMNSVGRTPRVNATVRTSIAPSAVARLGHVVLQTTNYASMADWYMRHLGLIPTDVQYLSDGSPMLTFFRLNLGSTPADHHTVVIASGLQNKYEHSAWEVTDLDALGQGQQVLRANGHRHMWGIGRHLLGSQIFDYWYDPDGFEFEHYADGDVFTADHETRYVPFSSSSIWAWGDDVPPTMFPSKSPAMLWRVVQLLRQGRVSIARLLLMGKAVDTPARPWL